MSEAPKLGCSRGFVGMLLRVLLALGLATILATAVLLALRYIVVRQHQPAMFADVDSVPARRVALVFGAGVWPSGQLSAVLEDRVFSAVVLYRAGKVEKLLMSGDNRVADYNEPQRMKERAMALGVPEEDIVLDYAGRRTYDSCYRARDIFRVPDVILVTQRFHLPRALLVADGLGLDAVGFVADRRGYRGERWYRLREVPATLVALWQSRVTRPQPVLGEPLPIFESS